MSKTGIPINEQVQAASRMFRPGPNGRLHPPVIVEILDVDDGSMDAAIARTLREKKRIQRQLSPRRNFWKGFLVAIPISIMLWILIFFVFGWRPFS